MMYCKSIGMCSFDYVVINTFNFVIISTMGDYNIVKAEEILYHNYNFVKNNNTGPI